MLARENGKLDEVFKDMKEIDLIFEKSRDLKVMFKSPIIPPDKKMNVVKALFEGKVNEQTIVILTKFVRKSA